MRIVFLMQFNTNRLLRVEARGTADCIADFEVILTAAINEPPSSIHADLRDVIPAQQAV